MTQDEIIRMATEVWGYADWKGAPLERLERFAALVAAHEREKQSQQEPVGWYKPSDFVLYRTKPDDVFVYAPLYAAPVQQFVLTDDEMDDIYQAAKTGNLLELRRAVIAADREKNK